MKLQFKYQTLSNFALLLMLMGLLFIAFINDRQVNRTITSQIEVRDVHYQALDKSRSLFALSSDTYAKITHYIDHKNTDDKPLILALKEMDNLIRENLLSGRLKKSHATLLRKRINKTKSLFWTYFDENSSYPNGDSSLQLKSIIETSFDQIRDKLLALPENKNNRQLQNLGLDLVRDMRVMLDSLSENEINLIGELDTLLSEMKLHLSKINSIFEEFPHYIDENESLREEDQIVSLAFQKYHNQYNKFLVIADAYLHTYEDEDTLDHISSVKEEFILQWQNVDVQNTLFRQQLNNSLHTEINIGLSFLVKSQYLSRAAMLIGLIIVLIAMILLRKALATRLNTLKNGANQITNGAFDKEIVLTSQDGFGELADAFNHMAEHIHLREIALSDVNANLEQRVGERTKELILSRDAAEAANVAKSDFLSTMSHEIRTPMNGVIGMLELLIRSPLQDDQKRFVTTASQSANNLLDIINEILDFSKIEAGQLTVENIAFNVTTLVEDCTSLLAERAHAKEIELICDVDPKLPDHVMGDPTRLRQVLINLIGNAIKFTESGEVVLRCSLNTKTNMLNFNVMDTGIGIPKKALAQLFTAFTQVDGSTTRKYGGTGLGLTISQRLTSLMGGKLAVDSEEGKGSSFHFELSLTEAEMPNTVNAESISLLTSLSDSHILIVDDNQTNLDVLSGYLTSWKISHDTAKSAKEALSLCKISVNKNQPYDLALLDLHMPEADGKQLALVLKADKVLSQIPLILLNSSSFLDSEATKLGFSAWLDKPIRQSHLQNVIRKVLFPESVRPITEEVHSHSTTLNGHVLLVDDHDVNLTIAKTTLEKMGVSVTTAINGQEAIDRWQQGGIDLILMDLQMPIMDGFQATQNIRQQEKQSNQRTPIIAMTANAMEEDKKRCLEYDMDGHLPKPFKWSQLEAMLSQWLPKNLTIDEKKDVSTPNVESLTLFINEEKEPEIERLHIEDPILKTESDTLDIERVNETIELFENDFIELVEAMLESGEESMIILAKASKDNDPDTLNSEAHRLKGGIGNLGSLAMMETCQLIERKSKAGELQEAKKQTEKLPLQFQQFKKALKNIIENKLNHTLDI